jgi:hypothetical protein
MLRSTRLPNLLQGNESIRKQRGFYRMVSYGMLRRVALVRTDVLKEISAIIGVTGIGELGTFAVTSN